MLHRLGDFGKEMLPNELRSLIVVYFPAYLASPKKEVGYQ